MTPNAPYGPHLPLPPSDDEKYSYFGVHRPWAFVWLFLAQLSLAIAFSALMLRTPETSFGVILLLFVVPGVFLNLWLCLGRPRMSLEDHIVLIEDWRRARADYPSVNVFLPSCGEDPGVLDNAFRHVSRLEWPGDLSIHVLDDADDPATKAAAQRWGLHYVVRQNPRAFTKAGNLINAFDNTEGDIVVVFDAGSAPRADYLWETVPYLENSSTGVIQTAQYFDVNSSVNEFERFSASLQEISSRWLQPARDRHEAAITAGTSVLYRREALIAAGGYARCLLGEDQETGVKIAAGGYRTRYLPVVVSKSVAPHTWSALTNQQYRQARSALLMMASSPFRTSRSRPAQRLALMTSFFSYLTSASTVLTAALPALVIVWFSPLHRDITEYLWLTPAIAALVLVCPLLARGWRPTILRVFLINSLCHMQALAESLRDRVRGGASAETATTTHASHDNISPRTAAIARAWFILTQGLFWVGLVHAGLVHADLVALWPVIALTAVQFVMLAPTMITLAPIDARSARGVAPSDLSSAHVVANPVFFGESESAFGSPVELAS